MDDIPVTVYKPAKGQAVLKNGNCLDFCCPECDYQNEGKHNDLFQMDYTLGPLTYVRCKNPACGTEFSLEKDGAGFLLKPTERQ